MKPEFSKQLKPYYLYAAVILTHDGYEDANLEPGAELWTTYKRETLLDAVIENWVQITDLEENLFPWRESVVIDAWIAFRKKTTKAKEEARQEYLT